MMVKNIVPIDENTLIRYCNSKVDKTTFKTGKRFNNFIQVKMISNDNEDVNEDYKIYKIEKMGYYEYVNIKKDMVYNGETCKYDLCYYALFGYLKNNKLWSNEDQKYYDNWKQQNNYDEEKSREIIIDEWFDYLNERFNGADFTISFDKKELKEILTDKKIIIVKQDFNCYCFNGFCECCNKEIERPKTRFFIIKNDVMSVENVIDELIKQDCKTYCNHHFLEFFEKTKNSDIQFKMCFGS